MTLRYKRRFEALNRQSRKAFMPFTLLGWPDIETSKRILKTMIESGASALELGFAFSEPVADGPIIQTAVFETLASGFRFEQGLELIRYARSLDEDIPIGLLVYYNMVLAQGVESFYQKVREAGADGVLIADLSVEVAEEMLPAAKAAEIEPIFIVSPLTESTRLQHILSVTGGFLYGVSRLGITGTEARYDDTLPGFIQRIKSQAALPLCIGFGVCTPQQAQDILALGADGVITGSQIIQCVQKHRTEPVEAVLGPYLSSMAQAAQTALG